MRHRYLYSKNHLIGKFPKEREELKGISGYRSHFCLHSPQTASQFCKTSATSLVALYHKGALPCECHPAGAIGHHCSPNGGQCPCRPGVTGQKCSRCQVGYFGFPHCKREYNFRSCESAWALLTQVFLNVTALELHQSSCENVGSDSRG